MGCKVKLTSAVLVEIVEERNKTTASRKSIGFCIFRNKLRGTCDKGFACIVCKVGSRLKNSSSLVGNNDVIIRLRL